MKIEEPEFRVSKNYQELADLFNYRFDIGDQDWTYTIVEPSRLDEYINAYENVITNEDTKFASMEMIIQSVNDQPTEMLFEEKWQKLEIFLNENFELHKFTIYYWCIWADKNIENCFRITPKMREFWLNK